MNMAMSGADCGTIRMIRNHRDGREDEVFRCARRREAASSRAALVGRGHQPHERRLDEDDARHVGVGHDGGDPEDLRRQDGREEDGRGAVGAAMIPMEAASPTSNRPVASAPQNATKMPHLRRGSEQQRLRGSRSPARSLSTRPSPRKISGGRMSQCSRP